MTNNSSGGSTSGWRGVVVVGIGVLAVAALGYWGLTSFEAKASDVLAVLGIVIGAIATIVTAFFGISTASQAAKDANATSQQINQTLQAVNAKLT